MKIHPCVKKRRVTFDFEKIFREKWKELSKRGKLDEPAARKMFAFAVKLIIREIAKVFE
jgi:hypothetical protein